MAGDLGGIVQITGRVRGVQVDGGRNDAFHHVHDLGGVDHGQGQALGVEPVKLGPDGGFVAHERQGRPFGAGGL